jgi:hypothetical protein
MGQANVSPKCWASGADLDEIREWWPGSAGVGRVSL